MQDIAVVDIKESFCSIAVFAEGWQEGEHKGSATVPGSFLDPASGTAAKVREGLDRLSGDIGTLVILLPRPLFHLTAIDVPAKNEALLARMMAFEAPRHFPMPPGQLVYGYLVSSRSDSGFSVNLAGLKKADFNAYFKVAEDAGLFPDVVSVSSHAFLPDTGDGKRAVVDIQPEGFEMGLMEGRRLAYSRFVRFKPRLDEKQFFSGGFMADSGAGTVAEQVAAEVNHIRLVGGVGSPEEYLDAFYIVGGGELRVAVANRISMKPDFASSAVKLLPETGADGALAYTARTASAAGLNKKGASFNFIPPEKRRMRHYVVKRLLKGSAAAIVFLLLFWGVVAYAVHWKALSGLKAELAQLKKEAAKDEGVMARMGEYQSTFDAFNGFAARKWFTLDLMEALTASLPKNTFLRDMEFRDCDLMVSGMSSDAAAILGAIESSPRFKNAHMLGAVQSTGQGERFKAGMECE